MNLLGRPKELRHLDEWAGRMEWFRAEARAGSEEAVAELRDILEGEIAELEERGERMLEGVEEPQLRALAGGIGDRPGGRGDAAAAL